MTSSTFDESHIQYDKYGQPYCTSESLFQMLYKNPKTDLSKFFVIDPEEYNESVDSLYMSDIIPKLRKYNENTSFTSTEEYDRHMQNTWHMPDEYKNLDIAQWLLDQCKNDDELQRVGEELLLFLERDMFMLLCYMKYMVDMCKKHNIVLGVGRGSSVASYCLYLIGVHKVNSIYYDIPIKEFLH